MEFRHESALFLQTRRTNAELLLLVRCLCLRCTNLPSSGPCGCHRKLRVGRLRTRIAIGLYLSISLVLELVEEPIPLAICLLAVTGLDICANIWSFFFPTTSPTRFRMVVEGPDLQLVWIHSLGTTPRCRFGLLHVRILAGRLAAADREHNRATYLGLIAAALAALLAFPSLFRLAFSWSCWLGAFGKSQSSAPLVLPVLAAGGVLAPVLLIPFLWDDTRLIEIARRLRLRFLDPGNDRCRSLRTAPRLPEPRRGEYVNSTGPSSI